MCAVGYCTRDAATYAPLCARHWLQCSAEQRQIMGTLHAQADAAPRGSLTYARYQQACARLAWYVESGEHGVPNG